MGSQINLKLSAEYKGRSWSILGLYHPVRACLYCHMASQFDSSDYFPCPLTEILVFWKNRICSSERDGLRNTFKRFDGDRNNRFDKTCSLISCKIMGEKGCRGIEKHVAEEQHWCFPSILHSPASNSTCSHFTSSRHREGIQYHTGSLESWKNSQIKFILKRKSFFLQFSPLNSSNCFLLAEAEVLNCEKASWFYCWWLHLILDGFDLQSNPLVWRAHPLKVLCNYFVHYDSSISNPKPGKESVKQKRQKDVDLDHLLQPRLNLSMLKNQYVWQMWRKLVQYIVKMQF